MKKSFAEILKGMDTAREKKISKKLPDWAGDTSLEYPGDLCLEQCSSSATARYKANLIAPLGCKTLTDITGGLGVDSYAFSKVVEKVNYNEQNTELAQAAERNFKRLEADNISVRNITVDSGTDIPESDIIFADPARRSASGKKVFMLEDCTPDILTLLPKLFEKAPVLLFKLSPMADICILHKKFAGHLRHLHIVSAAGEVKEILCQLDRNTDDSYDITVADAITEESMVFTPEEEERAVRKDAPQPWGDVLTEPGAALLKAGAFKLLCQRFNLEKIAPSTHLYINRERVRTPLCKSFVIKEISDFSKASLKEIRNRYPKAEVSARNIPMSSDELRKKLGIAPGGDTHIFGCGTADRKNILIICGPADF